MSLQSSTIESKIKYKIVLLGDQHVGKTSIIDRFINNRFQTIYNATIGIDFLVRNITYQNKTYRLQLWDTAGQERFKSLIPNYLKDSHLCIFVYDLGNLQSLESVDKWMEMYNQHREQNALCVIVGNKSDMVNRQCTDQIVQDKLKHYKEVYHCQISAKTGEGIRELFYHIIDLISHNLNGQILPDQIDQKEENDNKECKQQVQIAKSPTNKEKITVKLPISDKNKENDKKRCC